MNRFATDWVAFGFSGTQPLCRKAIHWLPLKYLKDSSLIVSFRGWLRGGQSTFSVLWEPGLKTVAKTWSDPEVTGLGRSGSDQVFLQYFLFGSAVTEKSALTPRREEEYCP